MKMTTKRTKILTIFVLLVLLTELSEAKRKKIKPMSKLNKELRIIRERETNPANFARLVVMRLIYGVASVMGFQESISGVFNGAFVPPGTDDDYSDYGGDLGIFDDDDY